eukprot:7053373-Karenia_brevis.AAC.1
MRMHPVKRRKVRTIPVLLGAQPCTVGNRAHFAPRPRRSPAKNILCRLWTGHPSQSNDIPQQQDN